MSDRGLIKIKDKKKIVVTGLGLVTSLGIDVDTVWRNILNGKSGINKIEKWDDLDEIKDKYNLPKNFPFIAGEVKNFDIIKILKERKPGYTRQDFKLIKNIDPFIEYACAASLEAVRDAGLEIPFINGAKVGVAIGSSHGGIQTLEQQHKRMLSGKKLSPFFIPKHLTNLASGIVSILLGANGINLCSSTACASGAHAIGQALRALKLGQNDIVIAGGSEAAITPLNIYGFHVLKVLSTTNNNPTKACRPFDKDRNGFVMSEGAGILVLEDFENARKRKAKIYGEIIGCAETGDAHHITEPNIKGTTSCMRLALKDAGIPPKGINLVNSHATSTLKGDLNEAKAIMEVFGQNGSGPFITANKSQIGHTLGAAGAIEAVISMLSIKNDIVPPVLNLEHPIKDCKTLNYIRDQFKSLKINTVISNSFGFGGTNACLVFKKASD